MDPSRTTTDLQGAAHARFLERIRKSFSHDLRTPLGTIANYAAVLESGAGPNSEEVRDLAKRIRANSLRAARMLQLLATATALAARPWRVSPTDLPSLARSMLVDHGGRGRIALAPSGDGALPVDAEVVGYAWRSFVAVEVDARNGPLHEAELEIATSPGTLCLELSCGERPRATDLAVRPSPLELGAFLRLNGGEARLETALGLGLAFDLVEFHGGELAVWGRPGAWSGVRLNLPSV